MSQRDLPFEIVKAIEHGINTHLNRSFKYSPFRLFYRLFKKSQAHNVENVRRYMRKDMHKIFEEFSNFQVDVFVDGDQMTSKGRELLTICYNIGINLLKKELDVFLAFKALKSSDMQEEIHDYILSNVRLAIGNALSSKKLNFAKESPNIKEDK